MTAEAKIAQGKMTLLQLAERLRNVSEACRRRSVSRSQFYEYKRAFQEQGFQGLMDRPPIPRSFPNETPQEVREKVVALSVSHPAWGRTRIADELALERIFVSPSTIRNIWLKEGLETRYKRILKLEEERAGEKIELTEEQIRLIEKTNPCFRERKVESLYPGYLLSQDTFVVGTIKGIGKVYLQAVVDTYGSYAFGKLYASKTPETAADVLYDRVLPFYEEQGLAVERILTDNGTEYCGRKMIHLYEIFLESQRRQAQSNQSGHSEDQRIRGAVQPDDPRRVLPGDVPHEALSLPGRASGRPRPMADVLQQRAASSGIPQHGAEANRDYRRRQEGEGPDG